MILDRHSTRAPELEDGTAVLQVTNALEHMPDCFQYMDKVIAPSVFAFCAIPQVRRLAHAFTCTASQRFWIAYFPGYLNSQRPTMTLSLLQCF